MAESSGRTRAQGWSHAKKDGHENERVFGKGLKGDQSLILDIGELVLGTRPTGEPEVHVDGAKQVKSIFDDLTVSKVDLTLKWDSGEIVNVSVKKSESGQVWLVSVSRFLSAMEFYLGYPVPDEVVAGISLFIGGSNLSGYSSLYENAIESDLNSIPKIAQQELEQRRLVAASIEKHQPLIWQRTLDFFRRNIGIITKLQFAQGLAISKSDCADVIIYNKVNVTPNKFVISKLIDEVGDESYTENITPGPRNGGSTILLPTGFLQMHHPQGENQMQFHHQYRKISKIGNQ